NYATFHSASIIWGLVAPKRSFNDQDYGVTLHGFWIGLLLPIPFYFLQKRFPNSWVRNIHIPVILSAAGVLPPAPPATFVFYFVVGFVFNFWLKRYRSAWWERYAFATSAGLDSGLAISTVIIFFALSNNDINMPEWWGTESSCRNENVATLEPTPIPA
ncbi:OPT-domain-containing protein, partial [Ramicandelaber brevisporus]